MQGQGDTNQRVALSSCHTGVTIGSIDVRYGIGINRSINQVYSLEMI